MDGEALGKALAWQHGDLRDWPMACPLCGSEDGGHDHREDIWRCRNCGSYASMEMVAEYREERAMKEVIGVPQKPTYPLRPRG